LADIRNSGCPGWVKDFDIMSDPEHHRDPYSHYEELRATCPVAHSERHGGYWIVTRHADISAVLQDPETFSSRRIRVDDENSGMLAAGTRGPDGLDLGTPISLTTNWNAAVLLTLRLIAALLMGIARRLPHARATAVRIAIANVYRPGALTTSVVLSLGLGLALLVTVIEIDGNLKRQFEGALPEKAPSFYFVDIQSADSERFDAFVKQKAPQAELERVPMLRGRIMSANGVKADDIKAQPNAAWVLQSDRGITFATEVPRGSTVVEGDWWSADYKGPPLISFEKKIADGLGLKIGDPLVVNVLGRNIEARIANLRAVQWENLGINFVLVF